MKTHLLPKIHAILLTIAMLLLTHSSKAQTTNANEFWICASTNTANLGTLSDPYDGSTQSKFDSAMNRIPEKSTIHILAGTYQTLGDDYYQGNGWYVKTGQKILGSGIDVTIIQLVHGAPDVSALIGSYNAVTNVEISDLTCDANYSSGNYTYVGVRLYGTENAVRKVKVINLAKFGGSSEAWGIELGTAEPSDSEGNIIEECEVSHFLGGSGITAINMGYCSGIIRNNRVFLPNTQSEFAINGNWIHDVLIEGNYVNGAAVGVYGDTGGATNITIINNTFKNCKFGVFYNQVGRNNIKIAYNDIFLSTNSDIYNHNDAIYFYGGASTNVNIIGNHVGMNGAPLAGVNYVFLNMFNVQGLVVANNTIDSNINSYMNSCVNTYIYNNYDSYGNYLTSLNIPMLGSTPVTSFGLNFIGSAGASPALTALGLPSNPLTLVTNNSTGLNLNGTFSGDGSGLTGITSQQVGAAAASQLPQKFISMEYPLTNTMFYVSTNHALPAQPQVLRWVLICKTNELGYEVGDEVSAVALVNGADNSKHVSESASSTKVSFTFSVNGANMQLPNKTNPAAPTALSSTSSRVLNWKLKCYAIYFP